MYLQTCPVCFPYINENTELRFAIQIQTLILLTLLRYGPFQCLVESSFCASSSTGYLGHSKHRLSSLRL